MAALNQSILANSAAIANVEVYVSNTSFVVANTVGNGNSWLITMGGSSYNAGEKLGSISYNLKFGANAAANDATVCSIKSSRDVGDSTPLAAQFIVTLRANSAGNVQPILAVTGYEMGTNKGAVVSTVAAVNGNTTGFANAGGWVLGASFSGGDGFSNVEFNTAVSTQIVA